MPHHVVCRTCATEGLNDSHETIVEDDISAGTLVEMHREGYPDHDVRRAEVD